MMLERPERDGPAGNRILRPARWVAAWDLWTAPRRVIGWVLAIELLSLGATAATAVLVPVRSEDWRAFGLLSLCAVLHIELSRSIEHRREQTAGAGPYLDLKSVWNFAALLALPPALASAMVVLTYGYAWSRVWHGRRPMVAHRWLYSCCTVLLANQAAVAVLHASPDGYPGVPESVIGLGVVVAAAILRWLVNYLAIIFVIVLASSGTRLREVVGNLGEQVLEVGATGLGLLAAAVLHQPVLLVGVLLALFALHRSVLLGQFQKAAQTDGKTGLYNADWWTTLAKNSLERTQRRGGSFGLLMVDVDFFKRVNDTHGHPAGDQLLKAIATTLRGAVRDVDVVGRFGGEEFVVALPDVTAAELLTVGERLRSRIEALAVSVTSTRPEVTELSGITVSIGAARLPETGQSVEELLLAADAALLAAKGQGRNRLEPAAGLIRSRG